MNLIIFIFCVLYFILAFRRLDWAVMFLIMTLPSYLIRFSVFGIPFTLLEAMILISFGTWFLRHTKFKEFIKGKYGWKDLKKSREKRTRYPFGVELILLLIISYIAVAVSGFSESALGIWKAYFFEPALFFILVLNVFGNRDAKKSPQPPFTKGGNKILWSLAISALAVSLFAIYQKFTGAFIFNEFWAAEETRRVTSFFGYPNAVGLYLAPIVMVLFGWLVGKLRITNYELRINFKLLFVSLSIVLSLLSIYFAKSEGALIGAVAGLVVFGLLAGKKARWATVGIVIFATASIMAFTPAREYAVNKILLRDLSGQIRKAQWVETWEMLKDGNIITGSGLTNYKNAIKPYHQEGIFVRDYNDPDWHKKTVFNEEFRNKVWQPTEIYLYPHNIFLNFLVELGIAGMFLFIWIIVKYFVIGMKLITNYELRITNNKFLIIGLICAMVVMVVHGLVDVPYFKNDLAVMFWVLIAMMSLINLKLKDDFRK